MSKHEKELALELRCVSRIEALGGEALKLVVLGQRGFLDRSNFIDGVMFLTEYKRTVDGKISAQQYAWARRMELCGFNTYFIDTDEQFETALQSELKRR